MLLLLEKYDYARYTEGLDNANDELAFRLLDFVCDHFGHNGTKGLGNGRMINDLIEFCEPERRKIELPRSCYLIGVAAPPERDKGAAHHLYALRRTL